MKQLLRCQRILILPLLAVSVFLPIVLLSHRVKNLTSEGSEQFTEDLSSIKFKTDSLKLSAVEREEVLGLQEPTEVVYKDGDFKSAASYHGSDENITNKEPGNAKGSTISSQKNGTYQDTREDNHQNQLEELPSKTRGQEKSKEPLHQQNLKMHSQSRRTVTDEKLKQMKDQVIRAKAYLNFAPPNSNSQLVRELKLRIKDLERAVGESTKDSNLSKSALQRMRSMEATLLKASRIYKDCSAMVMKLRAMTYNAEEQVQTQKNQATFLVQLAGRTTPKGLHCLSMRLTAEYFALPPVEREFPNQHKLQDRGLYHFAVFTDNVLACAVVVSSTVNSTMEPERIVFHVVTDSLNLPAISMWFLLNPPGKATVQVQNIEAFEWLSSQYGTTLKKQNSHDLRYTSALNHLRFYLPDVFPVLNKVLLLDHDVVVQRDLTELWNVDLKGKVIGAVETCRKGEPSFHQLDMIINFSDPMVAKKFDVKACTWAFGMNIFDLQEWRRRNLTGLYHKYLHLGNKRPLWRAGSLPLGWVTFYNRTMALDRRWHILGLGHDSSVALRDIDRAAVLHYDGIMKPWLDIGIAKYKDYWRKHVNYRHLYLQQCNIHG